MFTWWHWVLSSEKGKPQCMCLLKDLPLWCLLMFHWPKIITWSSPDSWWGRTETNYLLLERNSRVILHTGLHLGRNIVIIFINNLPHTYLTHFNLNYSFNFWHRFRYFFWVCFSWLNSVFSCLCIPPNEPAMISNFVSLEHKNLKSFGEMTGMRKPYRFLESSSTPFHSVSLTLKSIGAHYFNDLFCLQQDFQNTDLCVSLKITYFLNSDFTDFSNTELYCTVVNNWYNCSKPFG